MANSLIIRPHVLSDRDEIRAEYDNGATLQQIVDSIWPPEIHEFVRMQINGQLIPREWWGSVYPKPDQFIRGVLVFGGGEKGKQILSIVATIAIAIAAPELALAMGFTGTTGLIVTAGITVVGSLAIGALFKPPAINVGGADTGPAASKVYGISGQSNQATPYGIVPRTFGKHKLFPRIAATPFVDNVGESQYLMMLLDFGHGPLWVEDILIGETPIAAYKDVLYYYHTDFVAGQGLNLYTADVAFEAVGVETRQSVSNYRTTEIDTVRITLDFALPRGLVAFANDGTQRPSDVGIRIRISPAGLNAWQGFNAYPGEISHSMAAASKPNVGAIGSGVMQVYQYEIAPYVTNNTRFGLEQGATQLQFSRGNLPVVGNIVVFPDGDRIQIVDVTFRTDYAPASWVITLAEPLKVQYLNAVGRTIYYANGPELRFIAGADLGDGVLVIKGQHKDPFSVGVSLNVPKGQYDIEVTRTTPHPTDDRTFNDVFWNGLRSASDRPPIAPTTPRAILELRIKATEQLQGVIQNISAICTQIATRWSPGEGYVVALNRNPAWGFLEVLIGHANANRTTVDKIDIQSLYRWSLNCDSMINTSGVDEPRFLFDHVVDYATTTYRMLETIASAGRATVAFRDGKIGVIFDEEQHTPVQLFTPRNSWGFRSNRTYLDQPHALRMAFTDPVQGYQQGLVTVYANGYSAANASKFEDLQLVGVTRASQGWRDGRYMMYQANLRREAFTIETDLENLACLRGDLVWVQYDTLRVGGDSSRVKSVTGILIEQLDPLPTLPAGSYGIRIRKDSGEIIGPLPATPVAPNVWQVGAPFDGVAEFDLLVWGVLGSETGEYLVKRITPTADLGATLDLVEIARAIYTSDSGLMPPYVPPRNGRPAGTDPQPPTNLRVVQVNKTVNRRPAADIYLEWTPPIYGNYAVVRIYENEANGNLRTVAEVRNENRVLLFANEDLLTSRFIDSVVYFAAQAFDGVGAASELAYAQEAIADPRWVPDDIVFFSSNVNGDMVTLTWRDPLPAGGLGNDQVIAYDIRHSSNENATFDQATRISELINWTTHTATVPALNGVYLIKPQTSSGVRAKNSAKTVISTQQLVLRDWYAQPRFAPAWAGQFINVEKVGNELRLLRDPTDPDGGYYRTGYWIADYHETFNQDLISRITTFINAYGLQLDDLLSSPRWIPIASAIPIQGFSAEEFDAKLWVASSDRLTDVIADWIPLSSAVPLAGTSIDLTTDAWPIIAAEIEARQLFFIIELRSLDGSCTPIVTQAGADIDFPERNESHPDVATPPAGLRLVWDYPFVWAPNVAIDLQNALPGDYVQRDYVDQFGINIVVKNSAGVGIVGSVDVQAHGVGRLVT